LDLAFVDSIGQGRVYSGLRAKELGLVDLIGGLSDAIAIAAVKAGLEEGYSVVTYPELEDPIQALIKEFSDQMGGASIKSELGEFAQYLELLEQAQSRKGFQTRMEYDLVID
jgi:protease-4